MIHKRMYEEKSLSFDRINSSFHFQLVGEDPYNQDKKYLSSEGLQDGSKQESKLFLFKIYLFDGVIISKLAES